MRYLLSVLVLCLGVSVASAQEQPLMYTSSGRADHAQKKKKEGFDPSRLVFGGGIIAGFGTDYTDVGISPLLGYKITPTFSAGVSLGYEYNMIKYYDDQGGSFTNRASIVSPGLWARYMAYRDKVFIEANYENDIMHFTNRYVYNGSIGSYAESNATNINVNCLLMGVGLKYPVGGNVSALVELLYDVIQDTNSPYYKQPVFRLGIMVGL